MEVLGYISAIVMGMTLGIFGAGGSILTVPILVYLMKVDASMATGYSLGVVGSVACVGAIRNYRKGDMDIQTGLIFAIPALISVYMTRALFLPSLPQTIINISNFSLDKDSFILMVFAVVMFLAAISMIKSHNVTAQTSQNQSMPKFVQLLIMILQGALVGFVAGFVGAGGGFLIIPALVILLGMDMKKAVGTSLLIISIQSLIGFLSDVQRSGAMMDVQLLISFIGLAILGMFLGFKVSNNIAGEKLKPIFGYFILIMGTFIFIKEIIHSAGG